MKGFSLKLLIRRFVLATSFPPFLQLYVLFYHLITRITLAIFRRYPAIQAVYLRRGGARGEILPLVSDIDFAVIEKNLHADDRAELINSYERLARLTTILDQSLEIYDEQEFFDHYETNDYYQYRFTEGKKTWKLLFGRDYIGDLPDLPMAKMYGGFFTEIKVWWALFAWRFFQLRKYNDEPVTRNNVGFKTVSEILKMNLALNHDLLVFDRKKAISSSRPFTLQADHGFLDRVEHIMREGFRSPDESLLDETKEFLLHYLNNFYGEFHSHPHARMLDSMKQRVDCPPAEKLMDQEVVGHIDGLVHYVKEKWQPAYRGSYWAHSAYFNMDEVLFMVVVDPEQLPTIRELTDFYLFHCQAPARMQERVRLFLLLPNAAFQIDPDDFKKSWQSILFSPANPDLFALLALPEFCLEGSGYHPGEFAVWTPLVKHFFWEEKMLFYELLEDPSVYKVNSLDFLRIFWKTIQLVLMNVSVASGRILYPLTLPAIERGLVQQGTPLPDALKPLNQAYVDELTGEARDISDFIPAALDFLKEINR